MAITGSVDLGDGLLQVTVDHDPLAVITDVPVGSRIVDANGVYYKKISDTASPSVDVVTDTIPRDFGYNGFLDPENVQETFINGSMTLQLLPKAPATSFTFYSRGNKFTKTGLDSIILSGAEGLHYIYYDGDGVLQDITVWNDDLILEDAIVAIIYWDATNSKQILFAREFFHRNQMSGETHRRLHDVNGYGLSSGGALDSLLVDQSGALSTHCQFGNEASICFDEDAKFTIPFRGPSGLIPVYWQEGVLGSVVWRLDESTSFPVVKSGIGGENRAAYNQLVGVTWQRTQVNNNDFLLGHVAATNDTDRPFIVFMGQNEYANKNQAREGALSEINNLILQGLPVPEFKFLGTVIFQTSNGYINIPQTRTISTGDGGDYIDLRGEVITRSGSPGSSIPGLHASTHEDGGTDEIDVSGLSGLLADPQDPIGHGNTHENGGGDEISVAGLSGLLADAQTPTAHKVSHENGGSDEIDVSGLSGLLADPQDPTGHGNTHENGGGDEISVAGLSGLLADAQTPTAHASSHENGGGDEISVAGLSGLLADPQDPVGHGNTHESGGADAIKLDDFATPDDNTDLDATTARHGLLKKLGGGTVNFLRADGSWAAPGGGGWTGVQILYVGKHGNDSNDGKSPINAKLTISNAITAAASGGPYLIEVVDGGTYAENLVFSSSYNQIILNAPGATITGYIRIEADNVHINLYRHAPTTEYNTSGIYVYGAYDQRSIRIEEGYYSSSIDYAVRSSGATGSGINIWFGNCVVDGYSSTDYVVYNNAQGDIRIHFEKLDTDRKVYYSSNIYGGCFLSAKEIYINTSFAAGASVFEWAHDKMTFAVEYIDLNSRARLFSAFEANQAGGYFGHLENYSASYPVPADRPNLWGLQNFREMFISPHGGDGALTLLGNAKYFISTTFNSYAYYDFKIPRDCLPGAWEMYPQVITSLGDSSMTWSWRGNWAEDNTAYNTHSGSAISVGLGGAYGANDIISNVALSSIFGTKPTPGDHVGLGLARGNGTTGYYYFGCIKLVYFSC